jgi:tetratricopeptide (TPR) repeat protein
MFTLIATFYFTPAYSQSWRRDVRKGNEMYDKKSFKEAEKKYIEATKKKPENFDAQFNLADAYYKQKKYEEAIQKFNKLKDKTKDKEKLSKLYHNLGNSYLNNKKYEESIQSYKEALKLNPKDIDTKYNLAYASSMLQKQKQEQQKNKDKQKNKDGKEKEKQNQQGGDDKDKGNQQKGPQKVGEKPEGEKEQKPNPNQMKKEEAEQLLRALDRNEKNVQDKLKIQKIRGKKVKIEKDW